MIRKFAIFGGVFFASSAMASTYVCSVKQTRPNNSYEERSFVLELEDAPDASATQDLGMIEGKHMGVSIYFTGGNSSSVLDRAIQFDEITNSSVVNSQYMRAGSSMAKGGGGLWYVVSGSFQEGNAVALTVLCLERE